MSGIFSNGSIQIAAMKADVLYFYETAKEEIINTRYYDGRDVNEDFYFFINELVDDCWAIMSSAEKFTLMQAYGYYDVSEMKEQVKEQIRNATHLIIQSEGGSVQYLNSLQEAKDTYFHIIKRVDLALALGEYPAALFEQIEGYHQWRDNKPLYDDLGLDVQRDWLIAFENAELMQAANQAKQKQETRRL